MKTQSSMALSQSLQAWERIWISSLFVSGISTGYIGQQIEKLEKSRITQGSQETDLEIDRLARLRNIIFMIPIGIITLKSIGQIWEA